jgi:hypothetical protein
VRLSSGEYGLYFETSDGERTNETVEPVKLVVERSTFQPSQTEVAFILVTILALIIILAIIHMTSKRYQELKEAHVGRDREDRIEYITPEKGPTEEEAGPDDVGEDQGKDEAVHVLRVDDEEMERIEGDVDRLEEELSELDEELDEEEEELSKIDEEIEEIIDELEDDKGRVE